MCVLCIAVYGFKPFSRGCHGSCAQRPPLRLPRVPPPRPLAERRAGATSPMTYTPPPQTHTSHTGAVRCPQRTGPPTRAGRATNCLVGWHIQDTHNARHAQAPHVTHSGHEPRGPPDTDDRHSLRRHALGNTRCGSSTRVKALSRPYAKHDRSSRTHARARVVRPSSVAGQGTRHARAQAEAAAVWRLVHGWSSTACRLRRRSGFFCSSPSSSSRASAETVPSLGKTTSSEPATQHAPRRG